MEYCDFGIYKISRLGLGTVQLGLNYGIANRLGKPNKEDAYQILSAAISGGVNFFDTARKYGDSEIILGEYFSRLRPKENVIYCSKISNISTEISNVKELQVYINNQINQTLNHLRISKLPFYMLHDSKDLKIYNKKIIEILNELKDEGKIANFGVSVYTEDDVKNVLQFDDISVIQIPINIFNSKLHIEGYIKELAEKKIFIIARSIFLQGLFFLEPEEVKLKVPAAEQPMKELREFAKKIRLSIDELALGYVKSIPEISTIIIGAETPAQVKRNISLFNETMLSRTIIEDLGNLFANLPNNVVNPSLW